VENEEIDPGVDAELDDEEIWYSDDPAEDKKVSIKTKIRAFVPVVVLIVAAVFYLPTTVGGKVTLNSDQAFEFGQGVTTTVTCDGQGKSSSSAGFRAQAQNVSVTMTPYSTFVNASSSAGEHYFSGIKITGIPTNLNPNSFTDCNGADFVIRAYGPTSSEPLAFYNRPSTELVLFSNHINTLTGAPKSAKDARNNAFVRGIATDGIIIKSRFSDVTVNFSQNTIPTKSIKKITLETRPHRLCLEGDDWSIGDTGPAGGKIFYRSDCGFPCSVNMSSICHYLEVAPTRWNGTDADPTRTWAQSPYELEFISEYGEWSSGVGFGAFMTNLIIEQGNTNPSTSAAALAAGYSTTVNSVNFTDWHLPSAGELRELCINFASLGSTFTSKARYWSSTTVAAGNARFLVGEYTWPTCETSSGNAKTTAYSVRPIRAF